MLRAMGQPGTPRRSFVRLPVVEDFTASLSADVPGGAEGYVSYKVRPMLWK